MKHYYYIIILLLLSFCSMAQTTIPLAGYSTNNTGAATDLGSNTYQIQMTVTEGTGFYNGTNVLEDSTFVYWKDCERFIITDIDCGSCFLLSGTINVIISDVDNNGVPSTGLGAIVNETSADLAGFLANIPTTNQQCISAYYTDKVQSAVDVATAYADSLVKNHTLFNDVGKTRIAADGAIVFDEFPDSEPPTNAASYMAEVPAIRGNFWFDSPLKLDDVSRIGFRYSGNGISERGTFYVSNSLVGGSINSSLSFDHNGHLGINNDYGYAAQGNPRDSVTAHIDIRQRVGSDIFRAFKSDSTIAMIIDQTGAIGLSGIYQPQAGFLQMGNLEQLFQNTYAVFWERNDGVKLPVLRLDSGNTTGIRSGGNGVKFEQQSGSIMCRMYEGTNSLHMVQGGNIVLSGGYLTHSTQSGPDGILITGSDVQFVDHGVGRDDLEPITSIAYYNDAGEVLRSPIVDLNPYKDSIIVVKEIVEGDNPVPTTVDEVIAKGWYVVPSYLDGHTVHCTYSFNTPGLFLGTYDAVIEVDDLSTQTEILNASIPHSVNNYFVTGSYVVSTGDILRFKAKGESMTVNPLGLSVEYLFTR